VPPADLACRSRPFRPPSGPHQPVQLAHDGRTHLVVLDGEANCVGVIPQSFFGCCHALRRGLPTSSCPTAETFVLAPRRAAAADAWQIVRRSDESGRNRMRTRAFHNTITIKRSRLPLDAARSMPALLYQRRKRRLIFAPQQTRLTARVMRGKPRISGKTCCDHRASASVMARMRRSQGLASCRPYPLGGSHPYSAAVHQK